VKKKLMKERQRHLDGVGLHDREPDQKGDEYGDPFSAQRQADRGRD